MNTQVSEEIKIWLVARHRDHPIVLNSHRTARGLDVNLRFPDLFNRGIKIGFDRPFLDAINDIRSYPILHPFADLILSYDHGYLCSFAPSFECSINSRIARTHNNYFLESVKMRVFIIVCNFWQ